MIKTRIFTIASSLLVLVSAVSAHMGEESLGMYGGGMMDYNNPLWWLYSLLFLLLLVGLVALAWALAFKFWRDVKKR